MVVFYGFHVGNLYNRPMDGMGIAWVWSMILLILVPTTGKRGDCFLVCHES